MFATSSVVVAEPQSRGKLSAASTRIAIPMKMKLNVNMLGITFGARWRTKINAVLLPESFEENHKDLLAKAQGVRPREAREAGNAEERDRPDDVQLTRSEERRDRDREDERRDRGETCRESA